MQPGCHEDKKAEDIKYTYISIPGLCLIFSPLYHRQHRGHPCLLPGVTSGGDSNPTQVSTPGTQPIHHTSAF